MPKSPARKRAVPTRFDREQKRRDVQTLYFQGYTLADAARIIGVEVSTAKTWSAEGQWSAEIIRIRKLTQETKPGPTTAQKVALDLAATNKQSRAALAQVHNLAIMETLRQITEKPGKIAVETPQDLKALSESTAKVAGDWDKQQGNRFAVSLNINQIVQNGGVIEIPEGAVVEIEE